MEMREDGKRGEDEEQQRGRESAKQVKTWEKMARGGGSGSQQEEEGQSLSFSACVAGGPLSFISLSLLPFYILPMGHSHCLGATGAKRGLSSTLQLAL